MKERKMNKTPNLYKRVNRADSFHAHLPTEVAARPTQILEVLHMNGTLQIEPDKINHVAHRCAAHFIVEVLRAVQKNGVEYCTRKSSQCLKIL